MENIQVMSMTNELVELAEKFVKLRAEGRAKNLKAAANYRNEMEEIMKTITDPKTLVKMKKEMEKNIKIISV